MEKPNQPEASGKAEKLPAAEQVAGAHRLLKALQGKVGQHPELAEAITKLEVALSILTIETGGML